MGAAQSYLETIRADYDEVTDADLEQYYADNTHRLTLPDHPGWVVVIYTPDEASRTADRFAQLLAG